MAGERAPIQRLYMSAVASHFLSENIFLRKVQSMLRIAKYFKNANPRQGGDMRTLYRAFRKDDSTRNTPIYDDILAYWLGYCKRLRIAAGLYLFYVIIPLVFKLRIKFNSFFNFGNGLLTLPYS